VTEVAPSLLALKGVGTEIAASLLIAAGDNPERLRGEAAFAHLCGVAPIPASSHQDQHVAVALDQFGRRLGVLMFPDHARWSRPAGDLGARVWLA
jgi:transposase